MGMKSKLAVGVVIGITALGGIAACTPEDDGTGGKKKSSSTSTSAGSSGKGEAAKGTKKDGKAKDSDKDAEGSQATQFKAFVNKNGTPKEKDAVSHVTKVQGAEDVDGLLNTADIYTDYTGGLMGQGMGPSKLLASAFADWRKTDDGGGLVTVYDADGEMIGNGNY
ncbi:hypothetical protein GT204_24035 [Streptomyces sp. SID4919]|nr:MULTISPECIES: hypothetical protein [unclassified Streptomyces]MYY11891.1 hypothetical protein [Streptomyces sp. SID4919]SCK12781.1 hypothetical protein YW7DRAFT_00775 [Streptomyces sp. AmelKG-E11A]